jgi:hypothetical protein
MTAFELKNNLVKLGDGLDESQTVMIGDNKTTTKSVKKRAY